MQLRTDHFAAGTDLRPEGCWFWTDARKPPAPLTRCPSKAPLHMAGLSFCERRRGKLGTGRNQPMTHPVDTYLAKAISGC